MFSFRRKPQEVRLHDAQLVVLVYLLSPALIAMSWWDALKSKLPEGVRQLPFQTSNYFYGQPAADNGSRTAPRTIELSDTIVKKERKKSNEGTTVPAPIAC